MEQIEKSTYQGYLWYSDKDQPKVLNNVDSEITLDETKNPFVIEGQLFVHQHKICGREIYRQKICFGRTS